jgi:hypothetical protein
MELTLMEIPNGIVVDSEASLPNGIVSDPSSSKILDRMIQSC